MLSIDDVLVARDFSHVSDRALRYGLDLAARTGARLHVLYAEVLHEVPNREEDRPSPGDDLDSARKQVVEEGGALADAVNAVEVEEVVRRDVSAGPAILSYADEAEVDIVALGTHGRRGASRILLGSVAEEVVRQAQQPVLTVRGETEGGPRLTPGAIDQILVPVDFSEYSREALHHAKGWADLYDAKIHTLHVIVDDLHPAFYVGGVKSIHDVAPDMEEKVSAKLDEFVGETDGPSTDIEAHVAFGSAPANIAEFVEDHDIDLVSMSTHGRTGLQRFLLGSVAEKVVRHVRCPVLTVKAFGRSLVPKDAVSGG